MSPRAPGKRRAPLLGAHMSIAGGMERAVERAVQVDCTALQVFTKSSNQWRARPFRDGHRISKTPISDPGSD